MLSSHGLWLLLLEPPVLPVSMILLLLLLLLLLLYLVWWLRAKDTRLRVAVATRLRVLLRVVARMWRITSPLVELLVRG
jgi:hypothetical protein